MIQIQEGDFVEFTGYQLADEDVDSILEVGQRLVVEKVVETPEGPAYNVRPIHEDGSLNVDRDGDQIFEDELQWIGRDIEIEQQDAPHIEETLDPTPIDHDPIVLDLIQSTNNLTGAAHSLYEEHEELYYKLGGLLLDIKTKKLHLAEGYEDSAEGFSEFVKDNIGPKKRTIYYLIDIYKRFREAELTYTDLAGLGWTKARLLKDIKDKDKLKEFVEKAKTMTRAQIEQELLEEKERDGAPRKERFSFSFEEDTALLIHQALDHAMDQVGENKNRALELIITNYLVTEVGIDQPELGGGTGPF